MWSMQTHAEITEYSVKMLTVGLRRSPMLDEVWLRLDVSHKVFCHYVSTVLMVCFSES